MNYVGSISILDRGDAPAQAVIDRNARSLAQRISDETKEELEKVMTRVETIYSSFEDTDQIYGTSNLEYLQDIGELEEIMKDQVKKKMYQQQVTIFVVGYSDVCGQKLRLLQQVNEFFMENSKNIDEEEWFPTTPDIDLEEVGDKIDDSLQAARDLSKRLGELNKEMVDYMASYAEKKASNKGKKKMEKALGQAREEVQTLAEKLQLVQTELEEREEKLQSNFKQLELKNLEVQKFRTAAELAKKAVQDSEALQEEIAVRDARLSEQRQQLTRMEMELAQSGYLQDRSNNKLASMGTESQQKILMLQKQLNEQKQTADDVKRDLSKFHGDQLTALAEVHQQEIIEMKGQHQEQIKTLAGVSETPSDVGKTYDLDPSEDGASRQSSKQKAPMVIAVRQKRVRIKVKESRPSAKDKSGKTGAGKKLSKSPTRNGKGGRGGSVASQDLDMEAMSDASEVLMEGVPDKEYADLSTQDEGGDSSLAVTDDKLKTPGTRQGRRSRSTLAPVDEFGDFEDAFDLDDEQSWSTIAKDQIPARFAQYRRLCRHQLQETEESRQLTVAKTARKVQLLKAQFVEHKTKWELERKVLIEQVEQATHLQTDAEKEADQAMTQLEDFIGEQERLEEEEELRRSSILRGGRSGSSSVTPGNQTPGIRTPQTPASLLAAGGAGATPSDGRTTHNSEELGNLMQQTDDAKSRRSNHVTPSPSNTPGVMGTLLDVSRVPVHVRQTPPASPRTATTPHTPTTPNDKSGTSPVIVEAPTEASALAVAEALESVEGKGEKEEEEKVKNLVEVEEETAVQTSEVVEGRQEEAAAVLVEALELSPPPAVVETVDLSLREGGEFVPDLPADLPVIMLMGGLANPASVLAAGSRSVSRSAAGSRSSPTDEDVGQGQTTGTGSRSVPGSRRAKRVLILQPRQVPGSAPPARRGGGGGGGGRGGSNDSSHRNTPINTPTTTVTVATAPPSAAVRRSVQATVPEEETTGAENSEGAAVPNPTTTTNTTTVMTAMAPPTNAPVAAAVVEEGKEADAGVGALSAVQEISVAAPSASLACKDDQASTAGRRKEDTDVERKGGEGEGVEVKAEQGGEATATAVSEAGLTPAQVLELRERLAGTKSAPPGVDTSAAPADQDTTDPRRASTAWATTGDYSSRCERVPVIKGSQLLQLAARDAIELGGMTVPVVFGQGQVSLFDVVQGLITPYASFVDANGVPLKATTFLTPQGQLVVTEPMSPEEGAKQGLTAVDVTATPQASPAVVPSMVLNAGQAGSSRVDSGGVASGGRSAAGILKSGRSSPLQPSPSPISSSRQVSFSRGGDLPDPSSSAQQHPPNFQEDGVLSPRVARLRRQRALGGGSSAGGGGMMMGEGGGDLAVVMESSSSTTTLPELQEQALESMRRMLTMEENLKPLQRQTLDSVRAAMAMVGKHPQAATTGSVAQGRGDDEGDGQGDWQGQGDDGEKVEGQGEGNMKAWSGEGQGEGNMKGWSGEDDETQSREKRREGQSQGRGRRLTSREMLRSMTLLTLASQLSHEAVQLGLKPDSIFRRLGHLDTQLLAHLAPAVAASAKGQGQPFLHGAGAGASDSRETTAATLLPAQASDLEKVDGNLTSEEAAVKDSTVSLADLQDLPSIGGAASPTPSLLPPPTAATLGSAIHHDQLETPLAEIAEQDAALLAKGDQGYGDQGGDKLKEDASNLEKGRTDLTTEEEKRQGTDVGKGSESSPLGEEKEGEEKEGGVSGGSSQSARTPSKTPDPTIKIDGSAEDDLREASARSRASLRSHYKHRLTESRQAAEDRRKDSPHISIPSKMSVDDELVLDDDDEFDEDMALPDNLKELDHRAKDPSMYDIGTSPPPSGPFKDPSSHSSHFASRSANVLGKHPIMKEYLKTYEGVASFKNTMSKLFLDKDMMSASQILSDLETLVFDQDKKVMPQVEMLTSNALFILEEIASVVESAVIIDREPPVSSLLPYSRDEARSRLPPTREASEDLDLDQGHPKNVTPATALRQDHIFINNIVGAAVGVPGVGAQGADSFSDPGVAAQTHAPDASGRVSGGGEGSVAGGSRAGSLHGSHKSSLSGSTKQYLSDLQVQCTELQGQLSDENVKHEEQLRHNTVVMMEMQDTINELQRELSTLGKGSKGRSALSSAAGVTKSPSADESLMFTRLDLERNAKIMKKAVLDQRLDADKYKDVVTTMDDYVSLPAERLGHLVKKYVHHSRMKDIEENVKNSRSLDEGVFDTLDKMEALQNQRARHWAEKMDTMGVERLRLAAMLMDSLDSIEQESGLFLIKPIYSFRGRELKVAPTQKLARPQRMQPVPRHLSALTHSTASFVPAPTPNSTLRRMDRTTPTHQMLMDFPQRPPPPPSRPEDGVVGAGAIRTASSPQVFHTAQPQPTWNMSASHPRSPLDNIAQHSLNTPRMLELDINRMLIGQNNVSTKLPHPPTNDRLQNANDNGLRSYVTIQRPTATLAGERPTSANGGRDTAAPPSSPSPRPSPRRSVPVSPTDRELPPTLASASPSPLPPIGDRPPSAASSSPDDPEPPRSPPGSSMYQSTLHDADEGTSGPAVNTRTSSQQTGFDVEQD